MVIYIRKKNVKEYLSKASGFINRLPFVNLAEKHLGKVSALKKVIPYANYIACGAAVLIVFAVVSGIVAPGMKFNKWRRIEADPCKKKFPCRLHGKKLG